MKAIKITTDNVISVVDIQEPTLEGMQEHVGGFIEHVRPWGLFKLDTPYKENLCMIVNEEGRLIGLDFNKTGSFLYNDILSPKRVEPIVGDILIMIEGFLNGEPDILGLTDEQTIKAYKALKSKFTFLRERKCRKCGCTDIEACPGGCYWVEGDLCSECVEMDEEDIVEVDEDDSNS